MDSQAETITAKDKKKAVFPKLDVLARLEAELTEYAKSIVLFEGNTPPSDKKALLAMPIRLDSLGVVDTLCAVEKAVGFDLPDHIVQAGGYNSVAEAIDHIMPKLEKMWNKKNGA